MFHFRAPPTTQVTPFRTPPGIELIELVTNGVVYFKSGRKTLTLGRGALFWHRPGEETIHHTEPSAPYECLAIHFSLEARPQRPAPRLTIIADLQRTLELSRELLHAYHDTAVDPQALGQYAYSRFLWEAHLGTIRHTSQIRPPSISAALSFLEANFKRQEVGVGELAKAGGISEPHLHVLFRQYLGETPHQTLLSRRLHEAKLLLSGTAQSIKSLPTQCGFGGIETFYRAFGRHIGMTPLAYRRRHLHTAIRKGFQGI
jgi:AraC-like DNA-binding protein